MSISLVFAALLVVGIAAIGAYVKGPGLGNQIFDGLGRFGSANSLNQVLAELYAQSEFAALPAASLALTARLDVALAKYPPRHYRTVHVDAGIGVQNLYLTATAMGMACCAVSGFSDPAAESVLGLDAAAIVTMLVAVGPPRITGLEESSV